MSLSAGTMAGPYRIENLLGAGGMGEVYRAHDTRLKRAVALKLLPAALGDDAQRLRRFEQEARAVAALNHPNILAIHDIGTLDGRPYLVSEVLEGQSLRQRLQAGTIAPRKVAEYGAAIAQGLADAHAHGIVHRDIKPENIFVTRDDRIKILDFGLAKAEAATGGLADPEAPTMAASTMPGAVLGTVGYMAPEQARGQATDARSDIFSLGTVLYEMASGKRAFQKSSGIETLHAILNDEPAELASSDRALPPALTRIIERCLEKSPDRRLQSAQDLAFALENVSGTGSQSQIGTLPAAAPAPRRWLWWVTPAAVVVAAAVTWALARGPGAAAPPPQFTQLTFRQGAVNNARFEPNGAGVMYSAEWDGAPPQIFERRTGDTQARALGIAGALADVSATGQVAVIQDCKPVNFDDCEGTLAVASGGAARPVASKVVAAAFSPSGQLAVVRDALRYQLEYPVGHVLWQSPAGYISSPRFSPDGRSIAFIAHPTLLIDSGSVDLIPAAGGTSKVLASGYVSVEGLAWTPDGSAVEVAATRQEDSANAIHEIPIHGSERVLQRVPTSITLFDLAADGKMLLANNDWRVQMQGHFPGDTGERDLTWQDWSLARAISPDGKQVLFCECGVGGGPLFSAYIRPTDGGPALRLGEGNPQSVSPDWRFVLVYVPGNPFKEELLPTGVGTVAALHFAQFSFLGAQFASFGHGLVVGGRKDGQVRAYLQALNDGSPAGEPRPISGPVLAAGPTGPGDAGVPLLNAADHKWYLYPYSGNGTPRPLPALQAGDLPVGWSADGRRIYVRETHGITAIILALDLVGGKRTRVLSITPPNPAGVRTAPSVFLTPDARYYVYSVQRFKSSLFEAQPAKPRP